MNLSVIWQFLSLQLKKEPAKEKEQHQEASSELAASKQNKRKR